jgi:hypothetical protein
MTFVFIEFDQNWQRGGTVQYIAITNAKLIVVAEDATGMNTTYWFQVNKNEIVYVSYSENLVFIPARCLRKGLGDGTKCGRG